MSPSKKTKKKAAPKKKKSTAKKTAAKKTAKTASKSAKKKSAAKSKAKPKKASAAKSKPKKAAAKKKTAAKSPAKKATAKKSDAKKTKKGSGGAVARAGEDQAPAKKARPKKPVTPTGPRHPKLGYKWICFSCASKFYDLGKDVPVCPKCEADQRDRPPQESKPTAEAPKPKVVRPMAQLLDEEEPVAAVAGELDDAITERKGSGEEMFDEAETDDASLDIDDIELEDTAEPPELDEL